MIQVLVSGALGRMGTEICKAVDSADDMRLVAGARSERKRSTPRSGRRMPPCSSR